MKPYGIRNKVRHTVPGHQHCGICHPHDVSKKRARRMHPEDLAFIAAPLEGAAIGGQDVEQQTEEQNLQVS